jgi:hypothetical protein
MMLLQRSNAMKITGGSDIERALRNLNLGLGDSHSGFPSDDVVGQMFPTDQWVNVKNTA